MEFKENCGKCLEQRKNVAHLIKISCDHLFCEECLKKFWKKEIKKNTSPKFKCIYEICCGVASFSQVSKVLSEKSLGKLPRINCSTCKDMIIPINLHCHHAICSICFKPELKKNLKNNLIPKCPEHNCNEAITLSNLYEIGMTQKYIKIYQELNKINQKILQTSNSDRKLCEICLEKKDENDFQNLCCGHEFCSECILQEIKTKILSNQCDIVCPINTCRKEINYYIVKNFISKDILEKYDTLLMNKFFRNPLSTEKVINCPNCKDTFLIWIDAKYFTCSTCKIAFCSNYECLGIWKNHQNNSCLEYNKQSNKNLEIFKELVKKENWGMCPKCRTIIEKIKGCNYIRCESIICQRKICFCYLCSALLVMDHESDHFAEGNVFGSCKVKANLDKNCENKHNSDEEEKINEEIQKNEKEKIAKCPSCECETLKVENNFSYRIGVCKSEKCKSEIYCLNCAGNISNDKEEYIYDHYISDCSKKYKEMTDYLRCPGCECDYKEEFTVYARYVFCKKCKNKFCLKCKLILEKNEEIENHLNLCFCIRGKTFISNIFKKIFPSTKCLA